MYLENNQTVRADIFNLKLFKLKKNETEKYPNEKSYHKSTMSTNQGNVFGFYNSSYKENIARGTYQKAYTSDHNLWSAYQHYGVLETNGSSMKKEGFHTQTGEFWKTFFR